MARGGYGFMSGLSDGLMVVNELVDSESKRKSRELEDQVRRDEHTERQRGRQQTRDREASVAAEMAGSSNNPSDRNYENSHDTGGQVVRPRQPSAYEAYERAAQNRLKAGDTAGFEDFINKSASLKTLHFTSRFNDAYRRGDEAAILETLNEFPDGVRYSVARNQDGSLVATAARDDGTPIGTMPFKDIRELGAFVQGRMNPGDIAAKLTQEAKDRIEANLKIAQTGQAVAGTQKTQAETQTENDLRSPRVQLVGEQVRSTAANTNQSNASAALSRAQAGVVGQTPEMRNFGYMQTLPPEQQTQFGTMVRSNQSAVMQDPEVVAANRALLDAYADPVKRAMLTPAQVQQAEALLSKAGGQAVIPKAGAAGPRGQQGSGAPIVANALQQARDAIAKGADRNAVIERLKQNGIDPKGL